MAIQPRVFAGDHRIAVATDRLAVFLDPHALVKRLAAGRADICPMSRLGITAAMKHIFVGLVRKPVDVHAFDYTPKPAIIQGHAGVV